MDDQTEIDTLPRLENSVFRKIEAPCLSDLSFGRHGGIIHTIITRMYIEVIH